MAVAFCYVIVSCNSYFVLLKKFIFNFWVLGKIFYLYQWLCLYYKSTTGRSVTIFKVSNNITTKYSPGVLEYE